VQMGFVGGYGEWYYTDWFGNKGITTTQNLLDRKSIINTFLSELPRTRFVQLRTPKIKRKASGENDPLTAYDNSEYVSRMGLHDDCLLADATDQGTYVDKEDEEWAFADTKYTVWGGETCEVHAPRSQCDSALSVMASIHASYLNNGYNEDVLRSWKNGGCYNEISSRMGYRIALKKASIEVTGASDAYVVSGDLTFENNGFAAPYNPRELVLILTNTANGLSESFVIASSKNSVKNSAPKTNIRSWWPSDSPIVVPFSVTLPDTFSNVDTCKVHLHLRDPLLPTRAEYSIRLTNVQTSVSFDSETGYNTLLNYNLAMS